MCIVVPKRLRPYVYDVTVGSLDRAGFADVRREVVGGARGSILEIGAGTGRNLPFYSPAVDRLTLSEPDRHARRRLGARAGAKGTGIAVSDAAAEALPFPDASFDTVVLTLVLCTVDDPAGALSEIRRVLRPDGEFRFAEHVRSDDPHVARRQDRWRGPWGLVAGGCRPNRDTPGSITHAGFTFTTLTTDRLPIGPSITRPLAFGVAEVTR